MKLYLVADGRAESGGSPLIMHSDRLVDPLDEWTRKIAALTSKRKRTEEDHVAIGRLEFEGGMYQNGNGPCVPALNILRCLQEAASRHKRGKDVKRGVYPREQHADLQYEGPRDVDELWKAGTFALRKPVGVNRGQSRTVRTRPIFQDWQLRFLIEVDPLIFDRDAIVQFWREAGVYEGLGDMRPIYGRFKGDVQDAPKDAV